MAAIGTGKERNCLSGEALALILLGGDEEGAIFSSVTFKITDWIQVNLKRNFLIPRLGGVIFFRKSDTVDFFQKII